MGSLFVELEKRHYRRVGLVNLREHDLRSTTIGWPPTTLAHPAAMRRLKVSFNRPVPPWRTTRNFYRQREDASHEASGKPRINSKSAVKADSRKLSSIALQSIDHFSGNEKPYWSRTLRPWSPRTKSRKARAVSRFLDDFKIIPPCSIRG
jgi:hypothetical protein